VSDVGILIIDDDISSQRALKLVLDSEGWRVRILAHPSQAMAELANGSWDLAIVNVALLDLQDPLFLTLKELSQAEFSAPPEDPSAGSDTGGDTGRRVKRFRALFLVPLMGSKEVPLILEREALPYSFKPYHLHDFLQKVSDLLFESGAISEPLRGVESFAGKKRRSARDGQKMFASREDYQMTEEELMEFERQEKEEDERKKRAKQPVSRDPLS
jgi:CheY-like chemotaxis protein